MQCPTCKRPLWRDFLRNLYKPQPGEQKCRCSKCAQERFVTLPAYLSEDDYVLFGALLMMLSLLATLDVDTWPILKIQLFLSVFVSWVGLVALLTWTSTHIR